MIGSILAAAGVACFVVAALTVKAPGVRSLYPALAGLVLVAVGVGIDVNARSQNLVMARERAATVVGEVYDVDVLEFPAKLTEPGEWNINGHILDCYAENTGTASSPATTKNPPSLHCADGRGNYVELKDLPFALWR